MTMPFPRALPASAAALALSLAIGGCASTHGLAPNDRPMDADQLAAGRTLGAFSKADFPSLDWWTAFGDPQLGALIEEALAGNPSLAAADARVRDAIAQAGLAEAATQPSVTVLGEYVKVRFACHSRDCSLMAVSVVRSGRISASWVNDASSSPSSVCTAPRTYDMPEPTCVLSCVYRIHPPQTTGSWKLTDTVIGAVDTVRCAWLVPMPSCARIVVSSGRRGERVARSCTGRYARALQSR